MKFFFILITSTILNYLNAQNTTSLSSGVLSMDAVTLDGEFLARKPYGKNVSIEYDHLKKIYYIQYEGYLDNESYLIKLEYIENEEKLIKMKDKNNAIYSVTPIERVLSTKNFFAILRDAFPMSDGELGTSILAADVMINNSISNHGDINILDAKNGFKDLKIGDSINKWKQQIEFLTSEYSESKNLDLYKFKGSCCKEVFNHNVDDISLVFKESVIHKIILNMEKTIKYNTSDGDVRCTQYKSIQQSFNSIFGQGKEIIFYDNRNENIATEWKGNKIHLTLVNNYTGVTKRGYHSFQCYIIVNEIENILNGF